MLQIPCGGARSSKVNKAEQSTLGICLHSQTWILTSSARSQNQVADFRHHICPQLGIICKLTPNHLCLHSANKTLLAAQDGLLQVAKRSALFLQGLKSHQVGVTVPILKYVEQEHFVISAIPSHLRSVLTCLSEVIISPARLFLPARMAKERKESGNRQEVGWLPTRCCAVASIATVL